MLNACRFLVLLCAGSGVLACSAHRIAPAPAAAAVADRSDFAGLTVFVRNFRVNGEVPRPGELEALRESFADTLRHHGAFRAVHAVAPAADDKLRHPVLLLDVEVTPQHTAEYSWLHNVLAVVPGLGILWPIVPQSGTAHVAIHGQLQDLAGDAVWDGAEDGSADYAMRYYGWYRTGPVEEAYGAAYGAAFAALAARLAGEHEAVVRDFSRIAQPSDVITAAAPANQHIYNGKTLKIAVMPAQLDEAIKNEVPRVFDDYVLTAVQSVGNVEVIGQDDINTMLGYEQQKDIVGCDDASCIASIGGALGVDLLIAIKLARVDASWAVTSKVINVKNPHVEARGTDFVSGDLKALLAKVPMLVSKLFMSRQPLPVSTASDP